MTVETIAEQFATEGGIAEVRAHGGGHINDSYRLVNRAPGFPDYLLQRINHHVFKDVELLMRNMMLVTAHVQAKIKKDRPGDVEWRSLTVIPARDGQSFFRDPEGNYWRVLRFIPDHLVFDSTTDPAIAYEGARTFGAFTAMLNDLPAEKVGTVIPDFHNMKWRLQQLEDSIRKDAAGRLKAVKEEIGYVESRSGLMLTIHELGEKGAIPLRVTHNDTKISNVLFDRDKKGLCVIDLDTIQPGYVTSDFGDGIRTLTNTRLPIPGKRMMKTSTGSPWTWSFSRLLPPDSWIQPGISFQKLKRTPCFMRRSFFLTCKPYVSLSITWTGMCIIKRSIRNTTWSGPGHSLS